MFRFEGLLLADQQSFVPGFLTSADETCRHGGSSAIPPSASLYRERSTLSRLALLEPSKDPFATGRFWLKAVNRTGDVRIAIARPAAGHFQSTP